MDRPPMNQVPMPPQHPALQYSNPPPLRNPPPQVFGSFAPDASPVSNSYAQQLYADDPNSYSQDDPTGDSEQGDAKRRRIARACDMCRKKKIKCDGKMPKCSHCENYKTECIFTQVEKKRNPPKGAKYIEGLENRLGRMESLLRLSGLLAEDDGGKTDLGTLEKRLADKTASSGSISEGTSPRSPSVRRDGSSSVQQTPRISTITSPQDSGITSDPPRRKLNPQEVEALADGMCSLVTTNCGETRYIGSSSGFSIFSPKGIQWVNEKTGDKSFHDMISSAAADDHKFAYWKPEIFGDIFSRRTFKPLPPKPEALSLLKDFFENFNTMFPLFHEPTFMHLVDKHYSMEPYEGSGWWASLNVALAIAHRLRVMSNVVPQEEDRHAWGYLKNALAVQTELTMRNTDLLSVQALIGMAMFLQGTPNPQPSFFLIAAALRLAHSIGLHKRGSDFNLNEIESEQRKRVFWIAYMMDRDICLRSGRPPVQDDDDMNVELPSEDPPDNVGNVTLSDGVGKVNLFRIMCVFATIQSKVYKQLYSVKASRQSDGELLNTIGELDQELENWKESIPPDFRPENEIKVRHTPLILHIAVLHFAYYNCLTTIHRMSVHHGYWTSRLSDYAIQGLNARPLNPRVFMSAALCVNAARTSISLIKYIPHGDYACVWLILYYPVSALVTLFANILQNPQDVRARSDLKLMDSVVVFLSMLCGDESNGFVRRMLSICAEFERIAKVALDKVEREMKGRGKRKAAEREKDQHADKSIEQQQLETQASYRPSLPPPSAPSSVAGGNSHSPSALGQMPNDGHTQPSTAQPSGLGSTPNENLNPFPPTNQSRPNLSDPGSHSGFTPQSSAWLNDVFPGPQNQNGFPTPGYSQPESVPGMFGTTYPAPPPGNGNGNEADLTMGGSFQQPFVPQDLWQMPMTLEWDWADVGSMGNAFIFGDGAFGDGMDQGQQ